MICIWWLCLSTEDICSVQGKQRVLSAPFLSVYSQQVQVSSVHGWISVLQLCEQNHTQAYQIVVGRSGQTPPSLPALPYTPEQLYFIAYGQVHTSSHTIDQVSLLL